LGKGRLSSLHVVGVLHLFLDLWACLGVSQPLCLRFFYKREQGVDVLLDSPVCSALGCGACATACFGRFSSHKTLVVSFITPLLLRKSDSFFLSFSQTPLIPFSQLYLASRVTRNARLHHHVFPLWSPSFLSGERERAALCERVCVCVWAEKKRQGAVLKGG